VKGLYSNLYAMDMEVQQFKDFLGARGFKNTKEREIILKELEARRDHFNAEKLYSVLNRKGTKVSRPTIYRTLKLLEQCHLIERLDIKKNCFYYEPKYKKKDHGHLICEQCGKIIDFSCAGLENLKSEVSKERDFKTDNVSIHVFGICGTCQKAS
jgi:Fur family ferric uptake transcriptional regulator